MKRAQNTRTREVPFTLKPAAVAVAMALATGLADRPALANPTGPTVVNGQVTVNQSGNLLSITNSPSAIINWQAFSIGAKEITRFTQQSATSAVLNRVVGMGGTIDPSVILGTLQSNGRVFLLNPSGIVFGPGSQIDVAGLVASSLNLSNADFLGGRLKFSEVPGAGAVVNQGSINAATGGQVYLVGAAVTNSGIITSPKGEVILAAGKSVELVNPGTPNLRVEITAPDNEAKNLGSIVADAGRVGIYAGLINQGGTIRADNAVATEDGRIILKATKNVDLAAGSVTTANGAQGGRIEINAGDTALAAGTIEAKGATGQGGTVHLLGDKVGVYGNARVDVSGQTGGGTVLAGGEYRGGAGVTAAEGAAIRNATSTFFGSDAAIAADAIASGDGGKVVVWSDNTTRSYGAISARGGAAAGNGGLVETSGKINLDVTRGPDVRAPNGSNGTWLLDPNNLELVAGSEITSNTAQPVFATLGGSSRIGVDVINTQLNFGSNVVITTTNQGTDSGQPGNITVSAPILKSASTIVQNGTAVGPTIGTTSFTLQAHNNIVINPGGSIASTGDPLNVTLQANLFNPGTGTGGVTVNDGILTNGGALVISGRGAINLNAPLNTVKTIGTGVANGGVTLQSTGDAINVAAAVASAGSFSASGATGVTIGAPIMTPNNAAVSLSSSNGGVTVNQAITSGAITASGMAGVAINAMLSAPNSGAIQLTSSAGPVSVGAAVTGGTFLADGFTGVTIGGATSANASSFFAACGFSSTAVCLAGHAGTIAINAPVTAAGTGGGGAYLVADSMNIQSPLNAGTAGIVAVPFTSGRPINFGSEVGSSLSLTQAELSNLITSGPKTFGSAATGAITVSQPVTVGSSSVAVSSGVSITVDPGASFTTAVPLGMSAPTMALNGPVSAQSVIFSTNDLTLASGVNVTSAGNIDVVPGAFVPVNIGVSTHGVGSLDLTAAEMNQLVTGASGTLRIGATNSGMLNVRGSIAPAGTSTLRLMSGSGGISQDITPTPATIAVSKLELQTSGIVNLPALNNVQTLAANTSGSTFTFTEAPGQLLTIGNFGTTSTSLGGIAAITADGFNVAAQSFFGQLTVKPHSNAVRLDLGGADGAGVLGISQADLSNIFGDTLSLKADRADISTAVTFNTTKLGIAPLTAGLPVNIETTKTPTPVPGTTPLEFLPVELGRVSGNSLILGDAQSGTATVNATVNLTGGPAFLGAFTLQAGTGLLTVNQPVTANSVTLLANDMAINSNVTATTSNLTLAPSATNNTARIDLGGLSASGPMQLTTAELALLSAANGTLTVGSSTAGDVFDSASITFGTGQIGGLNLVSGTKVTVGIDGGQPLSAPGTILLSAPIVALVDQVTSTSAGNINLVTSSLSSVSSRVATTAGDINVTPLSAQNMALIDNAGTPVTGELTVSQAMLNNFSPSTGIVRIGNANGSFNARNITIRGPINNFGTLSFNTLSLVTNNGSVSETTGSTLTGVNLSLAVQASSGITLDQNNIVQNAALQTSFGGVNFKQFGSLALNIGTVAGMTGVQAGSSAVNIAADKLNINQNIFGGAVVITPFTSSLGLDVVAAKGGGNLELTPTELNRVVASSLTLGNTSTGNIAVATPTTLTTVSNLSVVTQPTSSFTVAAASPLQVPGNLTVSTGNILTSSTVTSTSGSLNLTADAMTFNATMSANPSFGTITIAPLNGGTLTPNPVNLGGSDGVALGLDATDIGNLSARSIAIGNSSTGSIATSTAPVHFAAAGGVTLNTAVNGPITVNSGAPLDNTGNLTLNGGGAAAITLNDAVSSTGGALAVTTGTGGTITVNGALSALGNTTLTADTIAIPGGSVSGANVALNTVTNTRIVNLGTLAGGDFAYDQAALNRISTPGTLTVAAGTINVTSPVVVSGAGNLALRANAMDVASSVTLSGAGAAGVLSVAPRSFSIMRLGGPGGAGGLELSDPEIDLFIVPSGVLRLGDTSTASQLSVDGPISINPASVGALTLAADGSGISQATGATITAGNLRLQTTGSVNLTQDNAVGVLAGSASGNFNFTTAGALAVGPTVDGVAGLSGGNLNLKADDLVLGNTVTISNFNVTLAPRLAGAAMNLGSNVGGVFSIDAAEMARVTGTGLLTFGTNTGGPVTVSAAMQRSVGSLGITAGPTQTVDVNAALGAPSGVQIDAGTINVSQPVSSTNGSISLTARAPTTLNINAPVTAGSNVSLTSDVVNIFALISANPLSGTVTIAPFTTGVPVSLGVETAGALSLTQAELALLSAPNLTLGSSTSGPMTLGAPITLDVSTLNLRSGSSIVQDPNSPLILVRVNSSGQRIGNLDVRSFGTGNGNSGISMTAANEIPGSLFFDTQGLNNDFVFVNTLPLRLQSVFDLGVTGRILFAGASFAPTPPSPPPPPPVFLGDAPLDFQAQLLAAINDIANINDSLESESDVKKSDEEKKKSTAECR